MLHAPITTDAEYGYRVRQARRAPVACLSSKSQSALRVSAKTSASRTGAASWWRLIARPERRAWPFRAPPTQGASSFDRTPSSGSAADRIPPMIPTKFWIKQSQELTSNGADLTDSAGERRSVDNRINLH